MSNGMTCPLCGGPNECGVAAGNTICWCFSNVVPPRESLNRFPEASRGSVCVCPTCARQSSSGPVEEGSER